MTLRLMLLMNILILLVTNLWGQPDSVDVTFFYDPPGNPAIVYLPGEFNNWGNNVNGRITDARFAMHKDPQTGIWSKTVRLRVGGPVPLPVPGKSIPGAYQYKFNENGSPDGWLSDPLNPRQNPKDHNNSYLFIRDPTIHYLLPNSTIGVVKTRFPEITAYIFPALSSTVDTSTIKVKIDAVEFTHLGSHYDAVSKKFSFVPSQPLENGQHQLILSVKSSKGTISSDTTNFSVQGDLIQILNRPAETWKNTWPIYATIFKTNGEIDSSVTRATIFRNDSSWTVTVSNGQVDTVFSLLEGENTFKVSALVEGTTRTSGPLTIVRKVNHYPTAVIKIRQNNGILELDGSESFDPDGQTLSFFWRETPDNPQPIGGITGATTALISVNKPTVPGEYFLSLSVRDPDGLIDSTRTFFVVAKGQDTVQVAGYKDNPSWVKNGRIYLLFFKAFTEEGTIRSAISRLKFIKALGFNIIWVMPVMDVEGDIDNGLNIGYNIIDFFNVDTVYGTNQDFKDFIQEAHRLGLKVILDITPNHTSRSHPFAMKAKKYGKFSPFWNYYQTQFISHNTNGLGQCQTPEGLVYYCGFSDALLNYNWSDLDARLYMIDIYKHWIRDFNLDGFRFDVYWGPHRRYGEAKMGQPVRQALKHIKPDILLLGEDDGTGFGTEVIYADFGGGVDVAYDFKLFFKVIRDFSFTPFAISQLHSELNNGGFYPGENSYFMRFMETQDEDRISYEYNSFEKTMPMATVLFTAPGIPLLYNGQEVGYGKGIPGSKITRSRSVIDWNFSGKEILLPHYHRLANIRGQFPAFTQHKKDTNGDGQINNLDESDFIRITTGNGLVYAFARPYLDENGLTVVNFSSSQQTASLQITESVLKFSNGFDPNTMYYVNDLYADTSAQVAGRELSGYQVTLPPYGSAIYIIAKEKKHVELPALPDITTSVSSNTKIPADFALLQNYPNPFNPATTIEFNLPVASSVLLTIYDILGRRVRSLVDDFYPAGRHTVIWNGKDDRGHELSSGIFIVRLRAGNLSQSIKLVKIK